MGVWDKLRGEFIDIIEWTDASNDTMVFRFERYGNEIKHGARLTVRESQAAVFVNEGRIADVFPPGMYALETANLPILSTLQGWAHGFQSPFKAEVYFVNTKLFTDLKWGTKNPIMLRDAEFGPLRLRAFGTYVIRVTDPAQLIREITGTDGHFTTDEISDQLRDLLVARFANVLATCNIPALDLSAHYTALSTVAIKAIAPEFAQYGIQLSACYIENISFPPEVEEALDRRTSMGVVGNLQAYTQYQAADALTDAAQNPNGAAGGGMGIAMGMAMAGQLNQNMQAQPGTPPPLPPAAFYVAINGQQAGPFDAAALQRHVQDGTLTRETLAWTTGMPQWLPAGDIPALQGFFGQIPPPLPSV